MVCVVFCSACSDDEPKTDVITETEQFDTDIYMALKAENGWGCYYYYERRYGYTKYDMLYLKILNKDTGEMSYRGADETEDHKFTFTYKMYGNKIVCECTPSGYWDDDTQTMQFSFEYRDGLIYPLTDGFTHFILSKKWMLLEGDGQVIENKKPMLEKIWLSESGLNIMDLTPKSRKVYRLKNKGSKMYTCYTTISLEYFKVERYIKINMYEHDSQFWSIEELTEDKLVLKSIKDDTVVTYYVADPEIIPTIKDTEEVILSGSTWTGSEIVSLNYGTKTDRTFVFNEDGTCTYNTSFTWSNGGTEPRIEASGTYKINADNIEFDFDNVRVHVAYTSKTLEGFTNKQPRKITCPIEITSLRYFNIDIPDVGVRNLKTTLKMNDWHLED